MSNVCANRTPLRQSIPHVNRREAQLGKLTFLSRRPSFQGAGMGADIQKDSRRLFFSPSLPRIKSYRHLFRPRLRLRPNREHMRLDLAVDGTRPETLRHSLRRNIGCVLQERGIPTLNLVA